MENISFAPVLQDMNKTDFKKWFIARKPKLKADADKYYEIAQQQKTAREKKKVTIEIKEEGGN